MQYFSFLWPDYPLSWYLGKMPAHRKGVMAFDKTPSYFRYERAAARVRLLMPDVKLIVVLRDPVERYVQYALRLMRLGIEEKRSF